jgi:hypothetical protein
MRLSLLTIFLFLAIGLQAQDKLSLRSGEILSVKIIEFGVSEIKYRLAPFTEDQPIFAVEKTAVARIELATGEVFTYNADPFSNSELYASQKKRALKLNFLSPLNNTTMVGFEQAIKPGRSFEVEVGYIGLGWDTYGDNPSGAVVKFGWKLMRSPDFYATGMRYAHALKGGYIKPEIIFASYNADGDDYVPLPGFGSGYGTTRENYTGVALLLNFGKQWIFDDAFLIDLFAGIGYGGILNDDPATFSNIHYGFVGGDRDFPIALSSGLRIGFLIK